MNSALIEADVTKRDECQQMVAAGVERYGQLDILQNNVGIAVLQGIRDVTEADWDRVIAVNLKGIVFATQAALPYFEAH
ncbi:MAG: SDR family NAD(P)-dependent oxidoreductase [Chloroflexi bacterium]|nr:SDR family NAD(P)-dependent oxidoreductase [Chloroflexota bacterium]